MLQALLKHIFFCKFLQYSFFCKQSGSDILHEATTFRLDQRVRLCAEQEVDHELLSQLSMGDMRALDAKDHSVRLTSLYRRARQLSTPKKNLIDTSRPIPVLP